MVLSAKDIIEPDFISLQADATALEAAKLMKQSRHGFVIVSSSEGKATGIVTEWDFLSKIVSEGRDPSSVRLGEIMSSNLLTAKSNDGLDVIAKIMAERGIRRVLVTDDAGKIIGVVTAKTILANFQQYIDKVSAQIARLQSSPV